ncbi:three-Cys-motif partner protein TcmP [Paenibacillus sp. GXUN7292]|uniref:three-Cys-motif partner protein TcmP n=1 Tax=Paenibacillus sp. GXUN7292 TaxID=3422499 RepID=UPI003D7EB9D4
MGQTKTFFKRKKGWSIIKDEIFSSYMTPYIAKLLTSRRPLYIIDCFAGQGLFDDGKVGSPIIIARKIADVLKQNPYAKVTGAFIEKKYYRQLEKNMVGFKNCTIHRGSFEDNINNVLPKDPKSSVFLYVDPYGIKSLDFDRFKKIKDCNYSSIEMLLNFNTFGFLREGCRLLKTARSFEEEYDEDYEVDEANTVSNMNLIAKGEYWIDILDRYNAGEISMFEAEELFTHEYTKMIKTIFRYVLSIPIKTKSQNIPKYRLIFASDNEDGLILMADNMSRQWKKMIEEELNGQMTLFGYDFPDMSLKQGYDIEKDIIMEAKKSLDLKDLLVNIIQKYGVSFTVKEYIDKLKDMEGKHIEVNRNPATTPTGRIAISWDYNKYKITISSLDALFDVKLM